VQEVVTKVDFLMANNIASHNKLFVDDEFVKECMLNVDEATCPETSVLECKLSSMSSE
jgi:hypothetical protein